MNKRAKRIKAERELDHATQKAVKEQKQPKQKFCNAKKSNGKRCGQPRGWGTNHFGTGRCKLHGGATGDGQVAAAKEEARHMATLMRVSPGQALAGVLHLSAGQLAWVTLKVGELDEEEIMTDYGVNRWVRLQRSIMHDVAKFAKTAADAGIDERMAKLAEEQTLMVGRLIEAVVKDPEFELTPGQQKVLGPLVRKHLTLAQGPADVNAKSS